MSQPRGLAGVSTQRDPLRDLLERFELEWRVADEVDLANYLPPSPRHVRATTLRELIKADIKNRWLRRRGVGLEDYLRRFPELGEDPETLGQLLFEEYCARQRHGDKMPLASYQARFPQLHDRLERLIQEAEVGSATYSTLPPLPPANATLPPVELPPTSSRKIAVATEGYRLLHRLGSGSFGEVWRAEAPGGVVVALKIITRSLDHATSQRELKALEVLRPLRHPFLVSIQAYWPMDDRLVIAMDLADGSLHDRLCACKAAGLDGIPVDELLGYVREVAEGLDYLHSQGMQHRDVKPNNILIFSGHARVADFGLVRPRPEESAAHATMEGTFAYMAPEVWLEHLSQHSDQYSLAVTYAELRLNRSLFPSQGVAQQMLDHLHNQPDLSPLGPAEQAVLLKALAKQPHERFESCLAFYQALEEAVRAGTPSEEVVQPQPARKGLDLYGWAIGGLSLLLLVLVGTAAYLLWDVLKKPPGNGGGPSPPLVISDEFVPAGFDRLAEARSVIVKKQKLPERIVHQKTGSVFLLIGREGDASAVPPFYVMEAEVSNKQFRQFVDETGRENRGWDQSDLPVVNVSLTEAMAFATWLSPDGRVPTLGQWDRAAGWSPDTPNPEFAGTVVLNQAEGPRAVNRDPGDRDRSKFGCFDMRGNVKEWTRSDAETNEEVVAGIDPSREVALRGKSYRDTQHFYSFVKRNDDEASRFFPNCLPDDQERVDARKPQLGFRVVLELKLD